MWDFNADMARWNAIALEAHARHSRDDVSAYIRTQSAVEAAAHREVARAAKSAQCVLEIGIGGGEHLSFAPDQPARQRYFGIDLNLDFAKICREKFNTPVAVADVAALPLADESFDCVIAMSVLEHVQPLERALAEIRRVIKPEGRCYVVVPTNGSLIINLYKQVMTYPTMRRAGIRRPDLVWHYLNVNGFKRIAASLARHFLIDGQYGAPWAFLPWQLSPLWVFHCRKPR